MRADIRTLAGAAFLGLAACSNGGNATVPEAVQAPLVPQTSRAGIAYGAETLRGAAYRGPAKLKTVDLGVLVRLRDPDGLVAYAKAVSDPRSGLYRKFLTPTQIADRFGASAHDYAAVRSYFTARGLAVAGWKQRELLRVRGSQPAMEHALGAHFGEYERGGRTFHSLTAPPAALAAVPVTALLGATTYARLTQKLVRVHGSAPASAASGYSPQQIAAAFDYNGAYALGYTGAGINIGIIGTGPIEASDLAAFRSIYRVAGTSTLTQIDVTNGNAPLLPAQTFLPAPPATDSCQIPATGPDVTCNPEDFEAQLDTEQIATLAQNARVLFYLAYAPDYADGVFQEGIDLVDYEIQQAINDNVADVLSMSFGVGERDDVGGDFVLGSNGLVDTAQSPGPLAFATLAAMGVAVFGSSGDFGATECLADEPPSRYQNDLCVAYPATDPNVVAVGGVNAPLATNGRFVGPITGWGLQTGGGTLQSASGGGISAYFPAPAYQAGASGVSGSTRNTPDLSLDADSGTGVAVLVNASFPDAGVYSVGGTSVAAPEAAAMWALVLQACKQNPTTCPGNPGSGGVSYRLGNPNPAFYALYGRSAAYAATFFDVLFGDNSQLPSCTNPDDPGYPCPQPSPTLIPGYEATHGYDLITGIGVPFARPLVKAIAGV